jgi:amidase
MTGPMARSTDDLALALDLTSLIPLPRARHTSLKGVRMLVMEEHPATQADSAIRAALRAVADKAANAGAILSTSTPSLPDRELIHRDYVKLLSIAMSTRGPPDPAHPEIGVRDWFSLLDKQADTARQWQRAFDDADIILAPVFGTTAFPHTDEPDWHKRSLIIDGKEAPFVTQIAWIGMATYGGMPSVSVPVGSHEGLPIGIQVIARHWDDQSAIAVAGMLNALAAG